jgi:hypothetical protein
MFILHGDIMTEQTFTIGKEFHPSPQFRKLYYIYLLLVIIIAFLPWYLPMTVALILYASNTVSFLVITIITLILLVPVLIALYWIPRYYRSIRYNLTNSEIEWRRGVWFKKTGIVPYNRITNVDISQGPISRALGIAALKIQTAGYSVPSGGMGGTAEIKLEGIEQYDELQELIMSHVRGKRPVAIETYEEEDIQVKMLEELENIRKLLEKSS